MATSEASYLKPADGLVALLPAGAIGFETCGPVPEELLHPREAEFVRRAIDRRRQEFTGGRLCARRALAELDIVDFPLLIGENRFPIWPREALGSITHTRGYCAAVVARRSQFDGIGVDVERRGRVDRKLESPICTEQERHWLASLPPSDRSDMATVLFSAKEAFYKCQYCVTGAWLGFHDAAVTVDGDEFEVRLLRPVPHFSTHVSGGTLRGRFAIGPEHVFAAIGLSADRSTGGG